MTARRSRKIRTAWWLSLMQFILVRYVRVDRDWVETVKGAVTRGPVCFVLRNRSLIDFLCLRGLLAKYGFPELGAVTGLSGVTYLPVAAKLVRFFQKRTFAVLKAEMQSALLGGASTVVFLRRPAIRGINGSRSAAEDGIRALVEIQSARGVPVLALPMVFLWGESAMRRMPGTMDFLFGSNEYPRLFRSILLLLGRRSVHKITTGTPINLASVRAERKIDDPTLTSVIRAGVGRQIELIRRKELGALTKPSDRIIADTLNSPRLARRLAAIAAHDHIPQAEIAPRARNLVRKMAANFKPDILSLFAWVLTFIWRRVYTGIDVREEDTARIKTAVSNGACLLLPSHKSHADYLVMSHLMRENNLMMPHIAAGQNLAFWPMGFLFRSSGAFFIRRSFVNDHFYTAVVSAYVRRLILEGYALEVFIEGGRSRTGKLLRPKTGMLEMALKALSVSPGISLTVLPIFIGYEHVIEEGSYVAESTGRKKKSESIKGLIQTTSVLFKRYGRLYVRAGLAFSVDDLLKEKALSRADLRQDSTRRTVAVNIGMRTLSDINGMTVVGAASILATVLLSHREKEISHDDLKTKSVGLVRFLKSGNVPMSDTVHRWIEEGRSENNSMDRVIRVFVKIGRMGALKGGAERYYVLKDPQRVALDYYKNNIIHFFVPASLTAAVCLVLGEKCNRVELSEKLQLGCTLYHHEFILPDFMGRYAEFPCVLQDSLVDNLLSRMTDCGVLQVDGDEIRIADRSFALQLAAVLRNYHEVYLAALLAARSKADDRSGATAAGISQEDIITTPEGRSTLSRQSATNTLKELRLLRPVEGETPFAPGALGDRLCWLLQALVDIPSTGGKKSL